MASKVCCSLNRPASGLGCPVTYTVASFKQAPVLVHHVGAQQPRDRGASLLCGSLASSRPFNRFLEPSEPSVHRSMTPPQRRQSSEINAAQVVVESFFGALNRRDVSALISLVDSHVFLKDLSHDGLAVGQLGVARFFTDLMSCLPESVSFVVEDATCGDPIRVAVMWRLDVAGTPVPFSCGVTFFRLNNQGLITRICQAPEHFPKIGGWAQGPVARLTGPLVKQLPLRGLLEGFMAAGSAIVSSGFIPSAMLPDSLLYAVHKQSTHNPARQITPLSSRSNNRGSASTVDTNTSSEDKTTVNTVSATVLSSSPVAPSHSAPAVQAGLPLHLASSDGKPGAPAAAAVAPLPLTALAGLWSKDVGASDKDSYERALDVWEIHGLQRATARLIEGMEIKAHDNRLDVHFLTFIPHFKVTERYVSGKQARIMRRDLRAGDAHATLTSHLKGATTMTTWRQPNAGSLEEVYDMSTCGHVLTITSKLTVGQRSEVTVNVWRKCDQRTTAKDLLHRQEKQHGSATSILRKFNMPV